MKTMTCNQLGGACEQKFNANTFDEIALMSKNHGMEMFKIGDEAHIFAMSKMQEIMKTKTAMVEWFENKRKEFELL
jgi:hypothetical protein